VAREIPELCKPGKDVSCEGQTIIDGATVPAIAIRMALSSVHIADLYRPTHGLTVTGGL
jgi:hypothetical protein